MKLGERIQAVRKQRGYSQEEFAEILGIGRSTLANYEQCKRDPSYETLELIADKLRVSPAYLMGWEKELLKYVVEEDKDIVSNVLKNALPFEEVNEKYSSLKMMLNSFGYDLVCVNGEYSLIGDGASVITKEEVEELYQSTVNFLEFNAKKLLKEKLKM